MVIASCRWRQPRLAGGTAGSLSCCFSYPNKSFSLFIPKNDVDRSALLINTLIPAAAVLCANEATGRITADRRHWEIITPRFNESRLAVYSLLVRPAVCPLPSPLLKRD